MKRILAAVLMCGAGSCIAADAAAVKNVAPVSTAATKAKPKKAVVGLDAMAPADEYFGPLKLSIIGISNTIRDVGLRYTYNHDIAPQSLASAQLTESAVRDWMRRYPRDPQLPRNVFFLQRLYTKILLQQSRDRAAVVAKLLFAEFPSSPQARQLKKTLAIEHLAPLSTPSPTDAPTPQASASAPDVQATAAPAYVAPPSVVPSGAIVPAPLVSGVPGTPVPASTASSSPLPSAAASPEPSASLSPVPPLASPTPVATPISRASPTPAASTPLPSPPPPLPTISPAPMPTPSAVPNTTPGASPAPTASATPH